MRKLLIYWAFGASLVASGCSSFNEVADAIPKALDRTSIMYKIDIQQGNVVEQKTVNRLQPDMSKSQVRYIMGTPLLIDVFHQDRWDYFYSMKKGSQATTRERISLFFEDDRLVRIEGDLRPRQEQDGEDLNEARVYSVPDYDKKKGIFSSALEKVGIESREEDE